MTNPVDEYLEFVETAKTANPNQMSFGFGGGAARALRQAGRGIASAAQAAAPAAILGGGLAMLSGAGAKVYRAAMKNTRFREMMEANPDLEEYHQSNPKQFNQHYDSLYTLNPRFASEPTVAGTYMRQMSMNPSTAGKVVVDSLGGLPRGGAGPSFQVGGKANPVTGEYSPSAQMTHDLY
jgi:hypothetical protein